eukprot:XP_011681191.1 PREDICTED: uncharacterized protein LOC105446283 isoform X1 [Strongylocentrotus purpuratus]
MCILEIRKFHAEAKKKSKKWDQTRSSDRMKDFGGARDGTCGRAVYQQNLLYTGQFDLKEVLPEENYSHFMVFSVAICILVSPQLAVTHGSYAGQLLQYFVSQGAELYGKEFLVYNVHALLHLVKDAQRFGSMDKGAAWKFENFMQRLKRKVRSGTKPAAQIVRRTLEEQETIP